MQCCFLEVHRGYIGLWGYEGSGDLRKYAIGKLTQNSGPSPALSASREWIVAFAYWIMRRTQRTHKCILNFPRPGNRRNASTRIELQYYLNVPYGGLCRRSLRDRGFASCSRPTYESTTNCRPSAAPSVYAPSMCPYSIYLSLKVTI